MEQINNTIREIQSRPPQASSQTEVTADIPVEQKRSMGDVIDRWRLNLGWRPLDEASQDMAIGSWVHVLDSEKVPHQAYGELFERALKLRALLLSQNKNVPDFGVELLLACWDGENGLRKELRNRDIESKKFLPGTVPSSCLRCHGTRHESVFSKDGRREGSKPYKCDHRELQTGEWYEDSATGKVKRFGYEETEDCAEVKSDFTEPENAPKSPAKNVFNFTTREVDLSKNQAQTLLDVINPLIVEMLGDKANPNDLLKFDEGVNRFRHPHRADLLYTEKDVKRKINDYKKVIAERETKKTQ